MRFRASNAFPGGELASSTIRSSGASITRPLPTSHGSKYGVTAAACRATNHPGNSPNANRSAGAVPGGSKLRSTRPPRAFASAAFGASDTSRTHRATTSS